jgi:hypothetical protein
VYAFQSIASQLGALKRQKLPKKTAPADFAQQARPEFQM